MILGKSGKMAHTNKRMNRIHFGSDPADIQIQINLEICGLDGVCALRVLLLCIEAICFCHMLLMLDYMDLGNVVIYLRQRRR